MSKSYHDYVIKDGQLVGDFEGLYRDVDDPWGQSKFVGQFDSVRATIVNMCKNLGPNNGVVEVGCGFGALTKALKDLNFNSLGVDVSQNCITKARTRFPDCNFLTCGAAEVKKYTLHSPQIFIFAEITWYILDDLDKVMKSLKEYASVLGKPVYLIHALSMYPRGVQRYGVDKFHDLETLKVFFNLEYLECASFDVFQKDTKSTCTLFLAKLS